MRRGVVEPVATRSKRVRQYAQHPTLLSASSGSGALDDVGTHLELDGKVLSRLAPLLQIVAPGCELVDAGADREAIETGLGDREGSPPAIVEQRLHAMARPLVTGRVPNSDLAYERGV